MAQLHRLGIVGDEGRTGLTGGKRRSKKHKRAGKCANFAKKMRHVISPAKNP
jgi:cob(I)alamin adenosyltransferase